MDSCDEEHFQCITQELGLADILRLSHTTKRARALVHKDRFWEAWISIHMELKHDDTVMDALVKKEKWLNYRKLRAVPRGRKVYGISSREDKDLLLVRRREGDVLFSPLQVIQGSIGATLSLADGMMTVGAMDYNNDETGSEREYSVHSISPPAIIRETENGLVAGLYEDGNNIFLAPYGTEGGSYDFENEMYGWDEARRTKLLDSSSVVTFKDIGRRGGPRENHLRVSLLPDGTLLFKDGTTYVDPSGRPILAVKLFIVPFFGEEGQSGGFEVLIALVMDGGIIQIYRIAESEDASGRHTELFGRLPELQLNSAIVSIETRFPPIDIMPRGGAWGTPERLYGSEVEGESLLVVVTSSPVDNLFVLAFNGLLGSGVAFSVANQGLVARHAQEVEGKGIYYSVATEYTAEKGNLFLLPSDGSPTRSVELPRGDYVLYVGNGAVLTTEI